MATLVIVVGGLLAWGSLTAEAGVSHPTFVLRIGCGGVTHLSVKCDGRINTNGYETHWELEYSTSVTGPWTPIAGGSGTIAQEPPLGVLHEHNISAETSGLTPEVTYYFRALAKSVEGEDSSETSGETVPLHPSPTMQEANNPTATTAHVRATVNPNGSETIWRFEYITKQGFERKEEWTLGPLHTIPQSEAEAVQNEVQKPEAEEKLANLSPATTYYARVFGQTEPEWPEGSGTKLPREATSNFQRFETEGPPSATTFVTYALHGEAIRALGMVASNGMATDSEQIVKIENATGGTFTLTFKGDTTAPITFLPHETESGEGEADRISKALQALASVGSGNAFVVGNRGGPYVVRFTGVLAGKLQPAVTANGSGLTPEGTATVSVGINQAGGEGYDTHWWLEYVSSEQFANGGWSDAKRTEPVDLGFGDDGGQEFVGEDLPGVEVGKSYRYRLTATNTSPGEPVVHGADHAFTVPTPAAPATEGGCPNATVRAASPAAGLADCRAYEQVTPIDKQGAMDPFHYGLQTQNEGVLIGEDGEHVVVNDQFVHWGSAGGSPYFFSRTEHGWQMTPGTPQPQAGIMHYFPELFNTNLTRLAFNAAWETGTHESSNIELDSGPAGGPYSTSASVPRAQFGEGGFNGKNAGWVAASRDFSKLIARVEDHSLCGHPTSTTPGHLDLYEYSSAGCKQVNSGIGSCGAVMVEGDEGHGGTGFATSSRHAVSADGSRVFFEAVPGSNCSEPSHLYVRIAGTETIDLGAYRFAAADANGAELLLERATGEKGLTREVFLEDLETHHPERAFSVQNSDSRVGLVVSEDMTAVYFQADEQLTNEAPRARGLYRYDITSKTLHFVLPGSVAVEQLSPDGRYAYFVGMVPGLPAGSIDPQLVEEALSSNVTASQVFRYDSDEGSVECVSCASPSDPAPRYAAFFDQGPGAGARVYTRNGTPGETLVSANGDFVFFDTLAALVPQDINGEIEPEAVHVGAKIEYYSHVYSPSSDVYEWRRNGVDGCGRVQGCVSLISSGQNGKLVMLLGATPSGHDVFFSTASPLAATDGDNALDVYDARIGGGFPPPPLSSIECELDTCSTPPSMPIDSSPASYVFSESGNLFSPIPARDRSPKKHRSKGKHRSKHKGKLSPKRAGGNRTAHRNGNKKLSENSEIASWEGLGRDLRGFRIDTKRSGKPAR